MENASSAEKKKRMKVIFIPGFCNPSNWIPYCKSVANDIDILIMQISSFASLHDRAVQIYYQLKGGRVDYGQNHSDFHKHSRYGRVSDKGLYEEWNEDNPIIIIGHSLGFFYFIS